MPPWREAGQVYFIFFFTLSGPGPGPCRTLADPSHTVTTLRPCTTWSFKTHKGARQYSAFQQSLWPKWNRTDKLHEPRRRREYNIKWICVYVRDRDVDWINLAHDRGKRRTFINSLMNCWILWKEQLLYTRKDYQMLKKILQHGIN
jgi:hypothetical protein